MSRSSLLFIKEPHYLKLGGFGLFEEVNHWGTLIGKKPLPLQDGEYLPEGEDGCFTGGHYPLSEFLEREQR